MVYDGSRAGLDAAERQASAVLPGLKRGKERQVPALPAVLRHPVADQLEGRPELILPKLIHQLMKFLVHRAHASRCQS